MNYYVQDSTIGKYVTFNTVPELVNYFKELIPRAFKISRSQYVQNLVDLGHGYDDANGIMLTRALSDQFNMGIIRNNNYIRTDVHDATQFKKAEYGDTTINRDNNQLLH